MFENQPCDTGPARLLPRPGGDSRLVVLASGVLISSEKRAQKRRPAGGQFLFARRVFSNRQPLAIYRECFKPQGRESSEWRWY
jgi:hypothetical protein